MSTTEMSPLNYSAVQVSPQQSTLPTITPHLFSLMMRNMSSDGFVFTDPNAPGTFSTPGCIIASPSYPADLAEVNQNYVYNWTRDAAITAMELAAAKLPTKPGEGCQPLIDYVNFANLCQKNCQKSGKPIGWSNYTIEGQPRTDRGIQDVQDDGPALQTLAILQAYSQLDPPTQVTAQIVIGKNLEYLLTVYKNPTLTLWEEKGGLSFFARAVQLRCFQEMSNNVHGLALPAGLSDAIAWLEDALQNHWNGTSYTSILEPQSSDPPGYDPNMDIVMASVYGAVPCTDTKLLATAALLRRQWADKTSASFYPINGTDQQQGMGPMLGRYPGDSYDGDTKNPVPGGHPWVPCTCNFAELYYHLANAVSTTKAVPFDERSAPFFQQIGIEASTPWEQAVTALQSAGDNMLTAIIFHSDHLELSEQFDGTTGYEKSVRDLTWSYASFLSAVRMNMANAS